MEHNASEAHYYYYYHYCYCYYLTTTKVLLLLLLLPPYYPTTLLLILFIHRSLLYLTLPYPPLRLLHHQALFPPFIPLQYAPTLPPDWPAGCGRQCHAQHPVSLTVRLPHRRPHHQIQAFDSLHRPCSPHQVENESQDGDLNHHNLFGANDCDDDGHARCCDGHHL